MINFFFYISDKILLKKSISKNFIFLNLFLNLIDIFLKSKKNKIFLLLYQLKYDNEVLG